MGDSVTIHDVANEARVSISTVSNVINRIGNVSPKTEKAVREAIQKLGYVPNYLLRSNKVIGSSNIGIVTEDISVVFIARIIHGICDFCGQSKINTVLSNLNLNLRGGEWEFYRNDLGDYLYEDLVKDSTFQQKLVSSINNLKSNHVSGIIYVGEHPRDISPLVEHFDLPCTAAFSYTKKDSGCYCVNNDDIQGAMLAVEYLIASGHEKIGTVTGETTSLATHKRLLGYQNALMKHRIPFNPSYIYPGSWSNLSGAEALTHFMKLEAPPTAIFAMNDLQACGMINQAHEMCLKIPDELSIIGFDDIEASRYTYPPLTTVHTPFEEMGYTAAQKLVERIAQSDDSYSTLLPCQLIERGTVTKPSKNL